MSKKEKIKKWLKENYKTLLLKIVLCIFVLFLIFDQIKTCAHNIERDSTNASITKRMHINNEGNYVSDNLFNIANKGETSINGITYSINNGVINVNGTTTSYTYINLLNYSFNGDYYITDFVNELNGYVYVNIAPQYYKNTSFTLHETKQILLYLNRNITFNNVSFKPMLVSGSTSPTSFEPYGLTYYSQEYINNHYVSNEENERQNNIAYNNGLTTNLQKALIDLLDTSSISGVYAYDSQNNIDYSVNYYYDDDGVRVENLPSKKGLVIQYNKKVNVDILRFDISSSSFVANDNWEYNYFKVYSYNSDIQNYVDLNSFTIDKTSSNLNINQTINDKLSFDIIIIGFDYLSSIVNTFENINLHSQVDHIYTSYYDTIYSLGYNDAILSGESFNNGYKNGFADGEKSGIYQGQLMQTHFSLGDIMKSIISAPVEVFGATLDFDIPGTNINIFSIIKLVVSLCVIGFAIKFFRS